MQQARLDLDFQLSGNPSYRDGGHEEIKVPVVGFLRQHRQHRLRN